MWRAQLLSALLLVAVAASGRAAAQSAGGGAGGSGGGGSSPAGGGGGAGAAGPPAAAPGPPPGGGASRALDAQTLLSLRDSVQNWPEFSSANNFKGWNDSLPMCQWSGVTCADDGTILTLSWQCRTCKVRAVGTLPPGLGSLATLATLDLQSNRFFSTLPPQWGEVDTWGRLQNLYLNDNNITGTLPEEWGQAGSLPSLLQLRVDSNRLTGTLPGNWGLEETSMRELGVIRISNNSLRGVMPETWGTPGAFPQLGVLALDTNGIQGTLPRIWGAPQAMTQLQELYLQNNNISGGVPATWGALGGMQRLRFLFAGNNPLGGTLPYQWGRNSSFPELKTLDLNGTGLYGTLPPEWGSPGSMITLDALRLQENDLSGSIPAEWANLQNLSRLIIRPGNPRLCRAPPAGLPFQICDERDFTCLRLPVKLNATCGPILAPPRSAAGPAAEADGLAGLGGGDQGGTDSGSQQAGAAGAPSGSSGGGGGGGGGGSSVGAIVGGVVGGVAGAAVLAGLLALLLARRKRRRREEERRAGRYLDSDPDLKPSVRPFISEEEEMEQGMSLGLGGSGLNGLPPRGGSGAAALAAGGSGGALSPFAMATQRDYSTSHSSHTAPAAAGPAQASSRSLGGLSGAASTERKPSKLGSFLASSGLLPSLSGSSVFARWCSEPRTESLELPPGAAAAEAEPHSPRGASMVGSRVHAMGQIAEEGEGASSELNSKKAAGEEGEGAAPNSSIELAGSPGSQAGSGTAGGIAPLGAQDSSRDVLPWSDWEIRPEEVEIVKRPDGSDWLLGSGGFGRVFKALRHGVQPVAVKIIPSHGDRHSPAAVQEARQEIAILRACRDVNIVQFVGAFLGEDETLLVTEYLEGGDLMRNLAAGRVSWYRQGKKIALDVARGLVFLHSRRIVHLDLKSPNILLARDGTAKIADVGMAKVMNRDYVTGVVSTLAWSAPEMLWGARCTEKADIYSFGIVLWEICSGEAPERGRLRDLRVPEECPFEVRQLILECLEARPSLRPTALQLVERLQQTPGLPPPGMAAPQPLARASPAAEPPAAAGEAGGTAAGPAGAEAQPEVELAADHAVQQQAAPEQQQQRQHGGESPAQPPDPGPEQQQAAAPPAAGAQQQAPDARLAALRASLELEQPGTPRGLAAEPAHIMDSPDARQQRQPAA